MREVFEKIFNEYLIEKEKPEKGNRLYGYLTRSECKENFYRTKIVDRAQYIIKSSAGNGNWVVVPWICIFDKDITHMMCLSLLLWCKILRGGQCDCPPRLFSALKSGKFLTNPVDICIIIIRAYHNGGGHSLLPEGSDIMEQYITVSDLIQTGIFLVGFTSLLYMIFHNDKKK